jgi:hypothetical protein
MLQVAYTTAEGRQELLDTIAEAANELGLASACLAEAYEQLDEQSADRLEEECFRPVQMAFGRAKRCHSEFAGRHGMEETAFSPVAAGLPSQGAAAFVEHAVEAAEDADRTLANLQDSMLPVEAGDEELRAGIKSAREPLDGFAGKAREFLRGLGR